MKGNFHVQFLGEGVAATSPPYPTLGGRPPRPTRPNNPRPTLTKLSSLAVDELFLDADFVAG